MCWHEVRAIQLGGRSIKWGGMWYTDRTVLCPFRPMAMSSARYAGTQCASGIYIEEVVLFNCSCLILFHPVDESFADGFHTICG